MKHCWRCGNEIHESAPGTINKFYVRFQITQVNKPYSPNWTSRSGYICNDCAQVAIGVDFMGENLNKKPVK